MYWYIRKIRSARCHSSNITGFISSATLVGGQMFPRYPVVIAFPTE